jgi:hypothetical protein
VSAELPDFHIPHAEKIEWMIETNGWAMEPVPARPDTDPPMPGYAYTIGFPAAFGFAELVLFGLTPAASRGMFDLVAGLLRAGTEIPVGVPVVGVLDNDLRCVFAPVELGAWAGLFGTATAWYRGEAFEVVQLLWPDRHGWLPTEAGFEERLRYAQPVIGSVGGPAGEA